jgi:hypothetical protein
MQPKCFTAMGAMVTSPAQSNRELAVTGPGIAVAVIGRNAVPHGARCGSTVELKLHEQATVREHRELGAFVGYCVDQIERNVELALRWKVTIARSGVCFSCEVIAEGDGILIRADGDGFDGAVAGRNAFIKIEKLLRAHLDAANVEVARAAG